jgi:tetratricopeptide (TPR) repeat protein
MKNHYQLLGVARDADFETIKAAHRRVVREFHPDLHHGDRRTERYIQQINAAFDVLKEPEPRAKYDLALQASSRRFRNLVLTGLVSAAVVAATTLLLLERIANHKNAAPVADAAPAAPEQVAAAPASPPEAPAPASPPEASAPVNAAAGDAGREDLVEMAVAETDALQIDADESLLLDLLLAWQRIERDANAFDMLVFSEAYAGTPAAALAEQRLSRLIETSDNIPYLIALGTKASGQIAERIRERLASLIPSPKPSEPQETAIAAADAPRAPDADPSLGQTRSTSALHLPRGGVAEPAQSPLGSKMSLIAPAKEFVLPNIVLVDADDANTYLERAAIWVKIGDLDRALADYNTAIGLDDENVAAYRARSLLWRNRGHIDRALADLDRAIRLSFADPEVYRDRGLVWYERGRYDRAIADFNQAIKLSPAFAMAYLHRAEALLNKGDFQTAIADFDRAIQLAPEMAEAHRGRDLAMMASREDRAEARPAPQ